MSLAAPAPSSSLAGRPPRDWGRDTLLDLAYEEYLDLLHEGRAPQIAAFCAKFPGLEESLAGLLLCHQELDAWAEQAGPDGWPLAVAQPKGFHDLKLIARGPLSSVYLAREGNAKGRPVVLKLSRLGSTEAGVHSDLDQKQHDHIATLLYLQQIQDGWTLAVMSYQGNLTLADLLRQLELARGKQRPRAVLQAALDNSGEVWHAVTGSTKTCPKIKDYQEEMLSWAEKLASALQAVHEEYAHGDIKPANVLLTPEGEPLLLDFNLARKPEGSALPPGGTLLYMAPELLDVFQQVPDEPRSLDYRRADQYAFGVMLIQLLTGQHPYAPGPMPKGTTRELAQLLRRAIDAPDARQWDRFGTLDGELRQLLRRCVAVDPKERWPDFAVIHQELQKRKERRTRRRWLALAASVALTVAAAAGWPLLANALAEPVTPASVRLTLKQGEFRRAFDEATQLIALGDRAEGHYLRAVASERLGEPQSAIAELQASLAVRSSPGRRALLGYFYGLPEINDGQSLRRECRIAREQGYETAANCNNLGYGYLKGSRYDLALECLNRAVELDASLATAYRNRARCYLTLAEVSGGDRAKYLPLAMQDCSLMLNQLQGGEVHFEAATAFAAVAKQDPTKLTALMQQVEQAVRHGIPANRFQSPSFRAFRSLPGFQQALASVPIAISLTSQPKVVRPKLDD